MIKQFQFVSNSRRSLGAFNFRRTLISGQNEVRINTNAKGPPKLFL